MSIGLLLLGVPMPNSAWLPSSGFSGTTSQNHASRRTRDIPKIGSGHVFAHKGKDGVKPVTDLDPEAFKEIMKSCFMKVSRAPDET